MVENVVFSLFSKDEPRNKRGKSVGMKKFDNGLPLLLPAKRNTEGAIFYQPICTFNIASSLSSYPDNNDVSDRFSVWRRRRWTSFT